MADDPRNPPVRRPPPPLVAVVGWLVPGGGYGLLGQWDRAAATGGTILFLFVAGLLIGGVRVMEVPGFDSNTGGKQLIPVYNARGQLLTRDGPWALTAAPLSEIRAKPWSLPQALVGPAAILAGWGSIAAVGPDPHNPRGVVTHSRINEIGQLYLSVAGLLNLLAVIDATFRAAKAGDDAAATPALPADAAGQVAA